jgi:hypothetical protein
VRQYVGGRGFLRVSDLNDRAVADDGFEGILAGWVGAVADDKVKWDISFKMCLLSLSGRGHQEHSQDTEDRA